MCEKVLIIGIDGASWDLLNPWISTNKLPTMKKIMKLGSIGILKSTIPCITIPAIPSMLTGMNPGNLGIFGFMKANGSPVSLNEIQYQRIWNILDKYNYKSCVVNLRFSFPPERLNGVMISGNVPSQRSNYTFPQSLKRKIKYVRFIDDKFEERIFKLINEKREKRYRIKLVHLLIDQMKRRYDVFKRLNQVTDYDFSIFWIEESDYIQHCCWEYKESLLQFYIEVDNILSDILLNFADRNFFVVSDHGFESAPERFFFVNTWLRKNGCLREKPWPLFHRLINFLQHFSYQYLQDRLLLQQILCFLEQISTLTKKSAFEKKCAMDKIDNFRGIDKKNSKAYLTTLFGITVNNSSNYHAFREEIIKKLRDLKDERGENVIRSVWKKEEIYTGKHLSEIPDIIFLTSKRYVPFPTFTRNLFSDLKRYGLWWQSGEHYRARDGIFFAYGPVIKRNNNLGNVNIEDICPTVLHLMCCKIPRHVDGVILTSIFKENSGPAKRSPLFEDYTPILEKKHELERKDAEALKQRLRKLGYL